MFRSVAPFCVCMVFAVLALGTSLDRPAWGQGFFLGENLEGSEVKDPKVKAPEVKEPNPEKPLVSPSATDTVVKEATAFILDRMPCSSDNYGDRTAKWMVTKRISLKIENGTMIVRERERRTRKSDFFAEHTFYTSKARLGDLNPKIGVKDKQIIIECTQGECFGDESGLYLENGQKAATNTSTSSKQFYRLCDSQTAERVSRAFSALITASGGKEPAF